MIKRLFPILDLLVITLVAYVAVNSFYRTVGAGLDPGIQVNVLPSKTATSKPSRENRLSPSLMPIINRRDLFQTTTPPEPEKAVEVDPEKIDDTGLRLTLLGTVVGESGYAVIEEKTKRKQDLYRVGESVQSAILKKILRRMVILDENGRETRLVMTDKPSKGKRSSYRGKSSGPQEAYDGPGKNIRVSRNELEKSLKNVNDLMRQVRVRPHYFMGKPDGLSLHRIKPDSIFTKMGLKNGDVIQGVGDQRIQSVEDVMAMYKNLTNQENVTLKVKRGGNPTVINYAFD